ncbi:DNA methylase family protein [Burkholderia multivorans]|uniref:DNA-methyltransferase n=1 Tax=Burkholderia multivorans TaxID=87883 RepID=UPI00050DC6EB|nr:site-specific DNA-methyltransferase [Burkholderia multivorans]KGC03312.1 DNA methylase family protein [Burkholderia multivorans]
MTEKVQIGDATLYLGDCRDILPTLPRVDAVITDPPYGIGESSKKVASRQRGGKLGNLLGYKGKAMADQRDYGEFDWDQAPPDATIINALRHMSKWQAFFGGNYFELPPTRCWLVWDKLNGENDFADCELAWTNWPKAVRRLQWRWNGMLRQGNEERFHPTQKPVGVMRWVLDLCPPANLILDPYMGSGTTGVACIEMGKPFIGIEREPRYFEIACRRIEDAQRQETLFEPPARKPEQAGLDLA